MSRMFDEPADCSEVVSRVYFFLDNELEAADVAKIEQHIHECGPCLAKYDLERKVKALDVCKRLLDYGFHAPTMYFPLVVPEALMMEPTETESKETLDAFADTLRTIQGEDPELLRTAPHTHAVSRPAQPVRHSQRPPRPARMTAAGYNAKLTRLMNSTAYR